MNKKDFDIIKKRKFKRYKSFHSLTKQIADHYDHCTGKGNNRISKEDINHHLESLKRQFKNKKKNKDNHFPKDYLIYNEEQANKHLSAQLSSQYRHYTGRPDSLYQCSCLDIDPRIGIKIQEFRPLIDFLNTFLPDSFYDYGSSGQSLNYYYLSCYRALYERVIADEDNFFFDYSGDKYCYMVNIIIDILSAAFQYILMINFPDMFLENIYPQVSEYDYYLLPKTSRKVNKDTGEVKEYTTHKTIYQRLTKNAHMMKLPLPKTPEQEQKLRNMPVLDPVDIMNNLSVYLSHINSFSFLSDNEETYVSALLSICSVLSSKEPLSLEVLSSAHSRISSLRSEIVRDFYQGENGTEDTEVIVYEGGKDEGSEVSPSITLLYTYMSAHSPTDYYTLGEKEIIEQIKSEGNAFQRSILYLDYLCWRTYTKEQRTPTLQEYRDQYRLHVGTDDEDEGDRKRLTYIYNKRIDQFDPNKIKKKLPYIKNEYIHRLKQEITEDKIVSIRNTKSSYRRPVTYDDLDACAGWIYFSLTNHKYIEMKKFSKKEFTVPAAAFQKWYNELNNKGIFPCRCQEGKSKACREILLHLGWVEYLDEKYCILEHISRRYILNEKHPRYKQFEDIFGKEELEKWKQWRDDRDAKKADKVI